MSGRPDGVVQRLNYIKDFFFDPCDAPFTLYVETMLPALIEAALLWYTPVPDEVFIAWARPSKALSRYRSRRKGTRGSKGGRRPRFGRLGRFLSFDVNEFIGKRLPGAELLGRGGINWLNFNLWRIFAFTQLLGLIWLVWEVVSGFFARWFSLLYETEYCQASARTVLDAVGFGQPISNVIEYNAFMADDIRKQRGPISWTVTTGTVTGLNVKVVVSILMEGDAPPDAFITLDLWAGTPGRSENLGRITKLVQQFTDTELSIMAELPKGGNFVPSITTNMNFALLSRQEIYVQGGPQN